MDLSNYKREKKKKITPCLNLSTINKLKKFAKKNGISMNKTLEFLINEKMEKSE